MMRLSLAGLIVFASLINSFASAAEPTRPPNVILLFADDLGYGDLSCFGSKTIRTPNLDRIAAEGIKLTNFYVAQAVCSASRAALLTGRYPNRVGILGALGPNATNGIKDREFTMGELFKSRGYATAIVGKWHLGHLPQFLPTRHGFDEYFGLPYSNDMWPNHPTKKDYPPLPLIDGQTTIETMPDLSKLSERYVDRALKFIERNQSKPFFLYLPFTFPHVPLFAGTNYSGKSPHGLYADVVEELDGVVGRILDKLKQLDLESNSIVVFTSDNGPWLSYGNHGGSSGGLREGKGTTFEGGVRVPFVARWPGYIPAKSVCHEPAMTIDLLPTLAKRIEAKLTAEIEMAFDGRDIGEMLESPSRAKSPHEALYFYWGRQLQAVRAGKWKLHLPHAYNHVETPGTNGQPGKIVQQRIETALFDLETDPNESTDVAAKHPDVVDRIKKYAEQARADLGDEPPAADKKGKKKD